MSKWRNFYGPGRSVVHSTQAMAATSHPLATAAAVNILQQGGNAVDAGIAACAVLSVVEPQMTGIGGDCFALLAKNGRTPIIAFNGSGRAPQAASYDNLTARGIKSIDPASPHSVTIPGAVDAWYSLVTDHGTKSFKELLQTAIGLARHGHPLHERVIFDIECNFSKVTQSTAFADLILDGGILPKPGSLYRNIALAETLEMVATQGPDAFYKGPIARRLTEFLRAYGGFHDIADFATHCGNYVAPIAADYKGHLVHQCPPNGQGVITLLILQILSHLELDPEGPLGGGRFHCLTEASRIAFSIRDAWLTDPDQMTVPWDRFLHTDFTKAAAESIRSDSVLSLREPVDLPAHKDTVYLTVVDQNRTCFSLINSLFEPFGSGLYEPETGILLQNRGASFRLQKDHPNVIAPGKRPMHTIIPGMVTKDDKVLMSYGVMGGHFQPVGHAYFLTNLIDYKMDMQMAVDIPRSFPQGDKLMIEPSLPEDLRARLRAIGHVLEERQEPIGGAQAIRIDPETDILSGCSDPRKDGSALGF